MNVRLYLDRSDFSAYYDDRVRDRQEATRQFWLRLPEFEVTTSEIAEAELRETTDPALRRKLLRLLRNVRQFPLSEAMRQVAGEYVAAGVFSLAQTNDALGLPAIEILAPPEV